MAISPLYQAADLKLAYQLRYSWTGWTHKPTRVGSDVLEKLKPLWEEDGLRLLEHRSSAEYVQVAFSTTPDVSPVLLASRAKGRLQHALKAEGAFAGFSRMVSVRSVGETTRQEVEQYIAGQVRHGQFADPRFRDLLEELDQLRGVEGDSAHTYFQVFGRLIGIADKGFAFSGRSRRPMGSTRSCRSCTACSRTTRGPLAKRPGWMRRSAFSIATAPGGQAWGWT